jgi:hypothetical protein
MAEAAGDLDHSTLPEPEFFESTTQLRMSEFVSNINEETFVECGMQIWT